MTLFVQIDRRGQRHDLDSPALIEAEAAALADEMEGYVAVRDNSDRALRDAARTVIVRLWPRLERLQHDLARWNEHAVAVTRA